ncbi:MAG: hypothetical protein GF307_08025 [candidate division Zixibacteria bacterium]|nr:hypothetical protein [candidate division Zixibacteria bacterium]
MRFKNILALFSVFSIIFSGFVIAGEGETGNEPDSVGIAPQPAIEEIYTHIDYGFQQLRPVFKRCCFDCHSNETEFPWYYKLPIAKQIINHDVEEGRDELLFEGGFPFKSDREPHKDLAEIKEVIEEGEMPPWKYTIIHRSAKLTDKEKSRIIDWVDSSLAILENAGYMDAGEVEHQH